MGNGETKKTAYNTTTKNQDIYYDVGFNQKIQVNTVATEVFHHDARRDDTASRYRDGNQRY